jgi:hypothetical protein
MGPWRREGTETGMVRGWARSCRRVWLLSMLNGTREKVF